MKVKEGFSLEVANLKLVMVRTLGFGRTFGLGRNR
jgi:hypothetical protein